MCHARHQSMWWSQKLMLMSVFIELQGALGLPGVDGEFRGSCYKMLESLRQNRQALALMMEAILKDPLLAWAPKLKDKAANQVPTQFVWVRLCNRDPVPQWYPDPNLRMLCPSAVYQVRWYHTFPLFPLCLCSAHVLGFGDNCDCRLDSRRSVSTLKGIQTTWTARIISLWYWGKVALKYHTGFL